MSRKQKYNFNFKLRLVTIIQQGKESIGGLSKRERLDKSSLKFWVKLYEYYGEQGLLGVAQKSFTIEEKIAIIQEYQQSGLSLMDTCVKYRISTPSVLSTWNNKFQSKRFSSLQETRGRPRKTNTSNKMTKKTTIPGIPRSIKILTAQSTASGWNLSGSLIYTSNSLFVLLRSFYLSKFFI